MNRKHNPPAFPQSIPSDMEGISMRDYFASAAMQGLIANPEFKDWSHREVAEESYAQADVMLEQRAKNETTTTNH